MEELLKHRMNDAEKAVWNGLWDDICKDRDYDVEKQIVEGYLKLTDN